MSKHSFIYQSNLDSENQMLDDLTTVLTESRVEIALIHRFLQAVSEAFTNALEHGNKLDQAKLVTLKLEVNETEIIADIADEGRGGLSAIRAKQPPDLLAEGGRGVDLMRLYTDETTFSEIPSGGLRVTLKVIRANREYVKKQ